MTFAKIVEGYVEQTFDERGRLISQHFVAYSEVTHYDNETNEVLSSDHPATNFYAPFEMVF